MRGVRGLFSTTRGDMSKKKRMANKVERYESDPANPANPAAGGLRFPRVLPAPWYRDPALNEAMPLGVADLAPAASLAKPRADLRVVRDRHYTAWRRLMIRQSMGGVR